MSQYDRTPGMFEGCENAKSACAPLFLFGLIGWVIIACAAYAMGWLG